ncbi:hypoxia up-regulated protein 1 isoform X2 [Corythoichthys intestinalis]|uniref:hypoxia up-regulated protein 1 isoform X2 n=1 Tax=Corythoichthys intestinalis TaxID=161448 RepID=UPI0025A5E19E|nr:hypoxia up-regulated protein 1 isoform X2 [Corythoichthys intestinalis]
MIRRKLSLAASFCLVLAMVISRTDAVAVMSIDVGSEWMKMAIVKPGVPMEIVLNKESRRKTPAVVCLKENERLFGDNALGVSVKNPKTVYRHLQNLMGKKHDNPQVAVYGKRFPEHQLQVDPVRDTVYFKQSEKLQYTPEELLGMMLNYSRGLAQDFAEQPIKDAVITVPAFYNQAERRSVLQAAHMAGLKVLQLINDNTAVALNYGVFRRKDIDSTGKSVMFYDMGSGSTTATIVTYQTVKTKESGTQPQLQIRGVGFDRGLGGFEMDLRLRDHLARLFNEQKKSTKDVRENHRAMAKLLKEAQRLKTVLSANVEFMAQVEGLIDEIDFKAKVTRAEFEDLCADLFERVPHPVQDALTAAEMNLDEIEQVILVGGSTRVPKVQEVLLKAVAKEELGKNINADEAAAMGAVYQAAVLSKAFKVTPFLVRDATVFPIQVDFTREVEEDGAKTSKHSKRILFQRMAPYPQRKVITFNRYNDDFDFNINYGDLNFLSQEDLSMLGSMNLTTVKLSGVGRSFQKHTHADSKGIKAHFNMDESGVLLLDRVESVFETVVVEKEEDSTLTKLGNTISTLFGGGSPEIALNLTEPTQEEKDSEKKIKAEDDENVTKPLKKTKISEDITIELIINDVLNPTTDDLNASKKKLLDLTDRDLAKQEREKMLNTLEAFIFETQDKLYQDDYQLVVTEEEREQISSKLSEASTWMDDEGYSATTGQLKEKLVQLKHVCKDMFFKVEERRKWPDRLATLDSMLNTSSFFLRSARLIPEDDQIFSQVELNVLEKVISETITWRNETAAEQEKRSPTEHPVMLSKDIEAKLSLLERELNYLLNKAKFAKPKSKDKVKNTTSSNKSSNSEDEEKITPSTEEGTDKTGEDKLPDDSAPTEESAAQIENDSQSQLKEETQTGPEKVKSENHIGDEL